MTKMATVIRTATPTSEAAKDDEGALIQPAASPCGPDDCIQPDRRKRPPDGLERRARMEECAACAREREDERHRGEEQNPRQRGKADADIFAELPQSNEDEREEEDASLRGKGVEQVESQCDEAGLQDGVPARRQPELHRQLRGGIGKSIVVICQPEGAHPAGSHEGAEARTGYARTRGT